MSPEKYSKYAADYRVEAIQDEKGHVRRIRKYVGPSFTFSVSGEERKKGAVLLGTGTVLSFAFTLCPLMMAVPLMHRWFASGSLILCLLGDVHLLLAFLLFLTCTEPATREQKDHIFDRFAIWSLLNGIFSGISLICQIVWYGKGKGTPGEGIVTLSTALLFITSLIVFRAKAYAAFAEVPGSGEQREISSDKTTFTKVTSPAEGRMIHPRAELPGGKASLKEDMKR